MSLILDGTNGITTPMYNGAISSNQVTPTIGFKNKIINGAMQIDQRDSGASFTPTTSAGYSLDRWYAGVTQNSKFTIQQNAGSVTPPTGFINYLGCTSSSAYTVLSGDVFVLQQSIEGLNIADLAWGTANAKTVTLSFQVYSSLTGTFGGSIRNSTSNRSYPFTYTISSANTWTSISVTIPGDTTGTWLTTNGTGMCVIFSLGAGSTYSGTAGSWSGNSYVSATGATSVVGTNGATFYITGVQLEVGSSATSFDYRSYGTELALCQRYLPAFNGDSRVILLGNSTTASYGSMTLPVQARTAPTGLTVVGLSSYGVVNYNNGGTGTPTAIGLNTASNMIAQISVTTTAGSPTIAAGNVGFLYSVTPASTQILFTGCEL
jgi:hypothetical protein